MHKFKCSICGYIFDESAGIPERGIDPATKWEDIPDDFKCPVCTAPKPVFALLEEVEEKSVSAIARTNTTPTINDLSPGEISAICSSLAKGCEKQRLTSEMEAFYKIADYFKSKSAVEKSATLADAGEMLAGDMSDSFSTAKAAAQSAADRGALRSLVWSEKVSTMLEALLDRFSAEGDAVLENTKIWVCDICGFIYIGNELPEICPVCKVPNFKIIEVERR